MSMDRNVVNTTRNATNAASDMPFALVDPFDEPLPDPKAILSMLEHYDAPSQVLYEGYSYRYISPPYMLFQEQANAKRRLRETYTQRLMLLLFGYSGCGKTTILKQFAAKYPGVVFYVDDFASLSPSQLLLVMGRFIHLPLKQRASSKDVLVDALRANPHVMFLFDEVDVFDTAGNLRKFDTLRKIHDAAGTPIVICGTTTLYEKLYNEGNADKFNQLLRRLDECNMKGMATSDAANYLNLVSREENVRFTFEARQQLEPLALNDKFGGIATFTEMIGRSITIARIKFYRSEGRSIPDTAVCTHLPPNSLANPGADTIISLPPTPEPITIDANLISNCLADFKHQFLKRLTANR